MFVVTDKHGHITTHTSYKNLIEKYFIPYENIVKYPKYPDIPFGVSGVKWRYWTYNPGKVTYRGFSISRVRDYSVCFGNRFCKTKTLRKSAAEVLTRYLRNGLRCPSVKKFSRDIGLRYHQHRYDAGYPDHKRPALRKDIVERVLAFLSVAPQIPDVLYDVFLYCLPMAKERKPDKTYEVLKNFPVRRDVYDYSDGLFHGEEYHLPKRAYLALPPDPNRGWIPVLMSPEEHLEVYGTMDGYE